MFCNYVRTDYIKNTRQNNCLKSFEKKLSYPILSYPIVVVTPGVRSIDSSFKSSQAHVFAFFRFWNEFLHNLKNGSTN